MQFHNKKNKIIIVDFGSQVTKLIARRVRELGVYSEIILPNNIKKIKELKNIKGIIFSGGPSTVTQNKFQSIPKELFKKKIPILGICYGLQLIAKLFGGKIKPSKKTREFGRAILLKKKFSLLTKNFYNSEIEYSYLFVFEINEEDEIVSREAINLLTEISHKYKKQQTSNNIIKRGLIEQIFGGVGTNQLPNSP